MWKRVSKCMFECYYWKSEATVGIFKSGGMQAVWLNRKSDMTF